MLRSIRSWPIVVRENLPLIAVTLIWSGSWLVASKAFDLPQVTNDGVWSYVLRLFRAFVRDLLPLLLLLLPLNHLLGGGKARDLLGLRLWRDFSARYLNPRVFGGFLVVLIALPVFYAAYRDWKTAIPAIVPFYLDPGLEAADRWLHGGRNPWEWLHLAFGRPARTQIIDNVYLFWFEVQFAVVLWMAFTRRRFLRARFFITYAAMYVLVGHLMATAFSAAGPAYYARVVGGLGVDPFEPLMRYLYDINDTVILFAVDIQERLWAGYAGTYDGPVSGISAFPSVHVAVAALFFLLGASVHRGLAAAFLVLLVVTQIGSVHLGWHYALDGYVSIAVVAALWAASGPLARAFFRWAALDGMDDGMPADPRGDDPGAVGAERGQQVEGEHGRFVGGGRRAQASIP